MGFFFIRKVCMYIHENIQISVTPFGRTGVNRQLHQTAVSFFIEIGKHLVNITPCTVVYSSLIMTLRCQVSRTHPIITRSRLSLHSPKSVQQYSSQYYFDRSTPRFVRRNLTMTARPKVISRAYRNPS